MKRSLRRMPSGLGLVEICVLIASSVAFTTLADDAKEVHVIQETLVGGVREQLEEQSLLTGGIYLTLQAPTISGQVFTHWSITPTQTLDCRDRLGRAKEVSSFRLYEAVRLTANYLPAAVDTDADGVADGWELYWYGNLGQTGDDDTDADGLSFKQELAAGTNPLMGNESLSGGVMWADGDLLQYNPIDMQAYTIRSEPDGELFPCVTDYVKEGTVVTSKSYDPLTSTFSYWTLGGKPLMDRYGRALNQASFVMGTEAVELVAHCIQDADLRAQYHWYGKAVDMACDTDGDGLSFAQEMAGGTNPLIPNEVSEGGIVCGDGELLLYNPDAFSSYTIRSEPEGVLFATQTDTVKVGADIISPLCSHLNSSFAYWTLNGIRQQDRYGRAMDQVTLQMPESKVELVAHCSENFDEQKALYWYGRPMDDSIDTDGDGLTFVQELAAGTNPLIFDESVSGGVIWGEGDMIEMDLQAYEQTVGAVVDGSYAELFTSQYLRNSATSRTFADGTQIWPVVADVNGDGLWDLVVVSETVTNVFVNVGKKGSPKFEERGGLIEAALPWCDMNSTAKLAGMTLDVEPVGALSATINGATMLVSDGDGRIWLYERAADQPADASYQLQHKVWGGSYAGFAQGLRLAAVDWEDDGDLDCICGTADGKLMLLRDPKVGRPTGLVAEAGVDNVLLSWEPNGQSRVRGYKVYRSAAGDENYGVRGAPALPTWRDYPEVVADYDYKVSAVSRFYTAGNSTPLESESVATEPVRAELGKVSFRWSDAAGFVGDEIAVDLGVQNSLNLAGEGLSLTIGYDGSLLQPVRVVPSGLTANVTFTQSAAKDVWQVTATGGEIAAGGGTFFSFVFKGLAETNETSVSLSSVTMKSVGGATVPAIRPTADALVKVEEFIDPEPAHARVMMTESVQVTAGESFTVVVSVTGEDIDVSTLSFDYVFDVALLSRNGNTFTASDVKNETVTSIMLTNVVVKSTDGAAAVVDSVGMCSVAITPKSGGESGHLANLTLGAVKGKTGETVEMPVGIKGAFKETTVDVSTWRFSVNYDKRLLKPVGIAATDGSYAWSAKEGVMTIVGTSGTLSVGTLLSDWKYPLALRFEVLTQYAKHQTTVDFESVEMKATNGDKILTPVRESGSVYVEFARPKEDPTVVVPYSRGDLNGDGRLTKEDKQLLAELMNGKGGKGKKPTAEQLRAGDYNGNGRLDQDDYQLLKDDFKARGIK